MKENLLAATLASFPMFLYFLYVAFKWATGELGPETQGWLVVTLPLILAAVFVPWAVLVLAVSAALLLPSQIAKIAGLAAIVIALSVVLPTLNASYCANSSDQSGNNCFPPNLVKSLLLWCTASGAGAVFLNQIFRRKRVQNV